jgi:hypothetical protein
VSDFWLQSPRSAPSIVFPSWLISTHSHYSYQENFINSFSYFLGSLSLFSYPTHSPSANCMDSPSKIYLDLTPLHYLQCFIDQVSMISWIICDSLWNGALLLPPKVIKVIILKPKSN